MPPQDLTQRNTIRIAEIDDGSSDELFLGELLLEMGKIGSLNSF
jgi:hypothetical protein